MRSPSLQRPVRSSSPSVSPYKDPNPYSKPSNKLVANGSAFPSKRDSFSSSAADEDDNKISEPTPQYEPTSQYMTTPLVVTNGATEALYGTRDDVTGPEYMSSLLGSRSDHERQQHNRPSDYSAPSIIYSHSKGVEINGLGDTLPKSSPPPPYEALTAVSDVAPR